VPPLAIETGTEPSTDQARLATPDTASVALAVQTYFAPAPFAHVTAGVGSVVSTLTSAEAVVSLPAPSTARKLMVVAPSAGTA